MSNPKRPLLSLTMIVKNEEADLAACLESVRGIVDELIVVDTGSTDRTVEIARAAGAQVHFFEWCDDFAAARNHALQYATGEWVMHLDADERAVETAPGALRREIETTGPEVFFLRVSVRNPHPDALGYDVYAARRLFRNDPQVRWHRRIHENIVHLGGETLNMDAGCSTLLIEHYGYVDQVTRRERGKDTRNVRLLKQGLAEDPDDYANYYYLAREYAALGHLEDALKLLRRAIKRFGTTLRPDFVGAHYCMAMRCAIALGRPKTAIKLGLEAMRLYAFSEVSYLLGIAYRVEKNLGQAERYFELAIALRSRFAEYQMEAGTGSWKALIQLGEIAQQRGDDDLALERARRALAIAPDQSLTTYAVARVLAALNRLPEAIPHLRRACELAPKLGEVHLALARASVATGDRQAAYDVLDTLVGRAPEKSEHWLWLGELLLELGEYEACVDVLGRAIDRHQDNANIYTRLGAALRQLGRYQDALNAYALASAIEPDSVAARAGLAFVAYAVEWGMPTTSQPAPQAYAFRL